MLLAERCVLLSAEILKSQAKYSEAAALLIRLTSEVDKILIPLFLYVAKKKDFKNMHFLSRWNSI